MYYCTRDEGTCSIFILLDLVDFGGIIKVDTTTTTMTWLGF
jgi:hypothetical protein